MQPDPDDEEIRAFVMNSCLPTHSLIAKTVEVTFGRERAWPVALIRAVRATIVRAGRRDRYKEDKPVLAFIADRADIATLDSLLAQGRATFGAERFPSRSHLHRMIAESRVEARLEAAAMLGRDPS